MPTQHASLLDSLFMAALHSRMRTYIFHPVVSSFFLLFYFLA